jgi:hypothetical protein
MNVNILSKKGVRWWAVAVAAVIVYTLVTFRQLAYQELQEVETRSKINRRVAQIRTTIMECNWRG